MTGPGTTGPEKTGPVLSVRGLVKRFGDVTAVDGVGFDLLPGASLGLVGESGSGKTTTARIVAGLERATAGTVELAGAPAGGRSRRDRLRRARHLQMIFQDPYGSFDPRRTVAQSIAEPIALHAPGPAAARHARVRELLDQVGLSARAGDSLPRDLSGGQRQRAAIARALGVAPRVLILDEAVAALDVSVQAQILTLLDALRRDTGIAYLFVGHDLAVVRHITDEVLVMRRGRVVERGGTERVLREPRHPYTRLLLDSVPVPGWDLERVARDRRALDGLPDDPDVPDSPSPDGDPTC
ncbi:ABC transporter ATP-binding protein [Actinomadura parmotrematis]|uniref:ATP-binding cassette domain-containing protein n=1 Tax=Actinomadura parmotrematis TaxID=2864039 RepID=A0ABS7FLJ1_9ACTN|nr:ATP-binding cassette domain-containing protein [Actinomadura parmotrematis]MBW8481226.1 ATP-binding cassette domain-containing protein [Actinomadura parmotrematis]